MKTVYALHGNPGRPQDWNFLATAFDKAKCSFKAVNANQDSWLEELKKEKSKVVLVGYSWGCYRLLSLAPSVKDKIEKIILISPYLFPERKLSFSVSLLLQLPVVGDKLIAMNHKKTYESFFKEWLYPQRGDEIAYFKQIRSFLSDRKVWKLTIHNKIKMQKSPLAELKDWSVPIVVICGDQDRISRPEFQLTYFKNVLNVKTEIIEGAGHGLIWTHSGEIVKYLKDELIGYYQGENIKNNVTTYLEEHLQKYPERVALRWAKRDSLQKWDGHHRTAIEHEQISFKNLALRISSFARGLKELGIVKGDRVIIFLPMSVDMYTAMFAVQKIGAIAVFLDSWARSHHLGASAECVQPKAMISFGKAFELISQVPEFSKMPIRVLYGPGDNGTHKYEAVFKPQMTEVEAVESEFSALITFTTGSTGKPKGANRTHRFLSAQHQALSHVLPYVPADIDMPAFPIFSLNNLASGVTTVLPAIDLATPSAKDSALLTCQLLSEKVSCTTLSPSMLVGVARYCQEKGIILSGLRRVVTGGAPISKDDVREFYKIAPQTDLWILYGSTEAEPMAHIEGRQMLAEGSIADPEIVEEGVNVGHISEDIDYRFIKLIDGPIAMEEHPWSQLCIAEGEVGEFICTGDHVCRDYYNNPEAFKSTKILDDQGRVWHRTGDLAYIDAERNLWIVGRVNNAIERLGKYYFPVRAEVILKRHEFTHRCAFLGIKDNKLGQATYAAIELKNDIDVSSFDFDKAKREIKRVFEKNQIPLDEIKFVKQIPMDPRHHSKVEYNLLREQLANPEVIIG